MATRTEYLYNDTNDLQITGGRFFVNDSMMQEAKMALIHTKGNYRQTPTYCVGLINYLGSSTNKLLLNNIISQELTKDRLVLKSFSTTISNENVNFDMVVTLK